MEEDNRGTALGNVIRIDDDRVREHLGRIVRGTVEETLNAMLEAEADRLCNAGSHEHTAARRDQRSRSYDRKLQTTAGEVTLNRRGDAEDAEAADANRRDRAPNAIGGGRARWRKRGSRCTCRRVSPSR